MLNLKLSDILNDRISGASTLYKNTIRLFLTERQYTNPVKAQRAVNLLRDNFPEMAVFAYLQRNLQKADHTSLPIILRQLQIESREEVALIGKHLKQIWKKPRRIVTLSRSSIVKAMILSAGARAKSVLISSSSPRNEGETTARELAAKGIDVKLVTDAALPGQVRRGDYILLGADCVTEKYFINKTGTYPLLLAARETGASSLVLYERFKRLSSRHFTFNPARHQPTEIIEGRISARLKVGNAYFEKIERRHIDYFVSGDGIESRPE